MGEETFCLKYRDTLPILQVVLKNPDGTVHDLTGSTAWKLHVKLEDGTVFTRDMVKVGVDTAGTLKYAWAAADWIAGLVVGRHRMEYEVLGGGASRLTFPNDTDHVLRVTRDIGQAA